MSTIKKINLILCLVVFLSLLGGGQGIGHAKALEIPAKPFLISNDFLNPDGSLKLDGSFSGSINLQDWDVKIDELRGPVFSRAPSLVEQGWSALGSGDSGGGSLDNEVWAIAIDGTDVYVGGFFYYVWNNGVDIPEAAYIAKWDGTNWSALGSNGAGGSSLNNFVTSIVVNGNDIYVGGAFENVNNNGVILTAADGIAKWDGENWSALGSNGSGNGSLNGSVTALTWSGDNLYVGGVFTDVNNKGTILSSADYIAKWDGTDWSALSSNGAGDGSLNAAPRALASNGSNVYVGGDFTNVNNNGTVLNAADYIAKWDGTNWSALGSNGAGDGSLNSTVLDIAVDGNNIYAGGVFWDVNNNGTILNAADYIATWDGVNWSALGSTRSGEGALGGSIIAIVVQNHNVYVGGYANDFINNGVLVDAADYIAKWDGANWSALGSDGAGGGALNGSVWALAVSPTALYAGGKFTNVNNEGILLDGADYIAKYRGLFTFSDVPYDYWSWSYIEGLYNAGVTCGCGSGNFCPTTTVTRDQMAVFLLRGKHGSSYSPPLPSGVFGDIPTDHWAAAWIERLAAEGVTAGCGSGNYCPTLPVTRDQMAVFLLRAKHGSSYSPPLPSGVFGDVPTDHWAAAWIEQLAAEGITAGCGNGNFCPGTPVTRDQMAVFLVRTFNLPVP